MGTARRCLTWWASKEVKNFKENEEKPDIEMKSVGCVESKIILRNSFFQYFLLFSNIKNYFRLENLVFSDKRGFFLWFDLV